MIMSIAAVFSRLKIIEDALGPETAPVTWLLWRRITMKIPTWFKIGKIDKLWLTANI